VDGVEEFDACAAFDAELAAVDDSEDFAVAADGEVTGALDGAGEVTEDEEVVALDGDAGDGAGFSDGDVAAGLDSAVPDFVDLVVLHADVASAAGALAGLCFAEDFEDLSALEAGDFAGGFAAYEEAEERVDGWLFRLAEAEGGFGGGWS